MVAPPDTSIKSQVAFVVAEELPPVGPAEREDAITKPGFVDSLRVFGTIVMNARGNELGKWKPEISSGDWIVLVFWDMMSGSQASVRGSEVEKMGEDNSIHVVSGEILPPDQDVAITLQKKNIPSNFHLRRNCTRE